MTLSITCIKPLWSCNISQQTVTRRILRDMHRVLVEDLCVVHEIIAILDRDTDCFVRKRRKSLTILEEIAVQQFCHNVNLDEVFQVCDTRCDVGAASHQVCLMAGCEASDILRYIEGCAESCAI